MNQVAILRTHLEDVLGRLVSLPRPVALSEAGLNRSPQLTELICRGFRVVAAGADLPGSLFRPPAVVLRLRQAQEPTAEHWRQARRVWEGVGAAPSHSAVAFLSLEREAPRGVITGTVLSGRGGEPLHALKIIGPGMHKALTSAGWRADPEPAVRSDERQRWSRAIGALGEDTWRRLRSLRYGLVGVGRSGSLVATSLARLGARDVTLIDPDRLEPHNLDAMDGVTEGDVGRHKVSGILGSLAAVSSFLQAAYIVPDSITTLRALVAVKEADVLITCVDHDSARMAAAVIASLYAKPLLEIGTGILGSGDQRRMGADVRLTLPGDRCLLCLGGLANLAQARAGLPSNLVPSPRRFNWRDERAGSLRSLNQVAVHLGMRLLEDLVEERVTSSRWIRLEFDPRGSPTLRTLLPPEDRDCPLCRQMGAGDAGLDYVRELGEALQGSQGLAGGQGRPEA
jgi:hypothetical protein